MVDQYREIVRDFILSQDRLLRMSSKATNSFDSCPECEYEFRHVESVHPRKGYNVLWESAESWKIKCKGCDTTFHVQR